MDQMSKYMVTDHDGSEVLGKIVYYSVPSTLVYRKPLKKLCEDMGFPVQPSERTSPYNAFRSATGDVRDHKVMMEPDGVRIFNIFFRDNSTPDGVVSRELVKETLDAKDNLYEHLANVSYDRDTETFSYENLAADSDVDPLDYCRQAQELFCKYQECVNRGQIETMLDNYIASLGPAKLLSRGKLFFILRGEMHKLDLFEEFVQALEELNVLSTPARGRLIANSMYAVDSEKQRACMAAAFYDTTRKQIHTYEESIEKLLRNGCSSPKVLERWIAKIQGLEMLKKEYEDVLQRQLQDLDAEFNTLSLLGRQLHIQELGIQSKSRVWRQSVPNTGTAAA